MRSDVATSRIVAATAATLTITGQDSDGEPADPGTVTVAVTDSEGAAIAAGAVGESGNDRTSALTASQTASVDRLSAVWTAGGVTVQTTTHDVVGGVYATVATIRDKTEALKSATKHTAAELITARTEVEYQFERATNRAFVPRFREDRLKGTGTDTLLLERPNLREVVWAQYHDGSTWQDMTATLSEVEADDAGCAVLTDDTWPLGAPIKVGYRYGFDTPPPDLVAAACRAVEYRRQSLTTGIPDRAISMQGFDSGNITLATPGVGMWVTAIPVVDEVLKAYTFRRVAIA